MIYIILSLLFFSLVPHESSAVEHDKFIIITPPKCGTNMLRKTLTLITKDPHFFHLDLYMVQFDAETFEEKLIELEKERTFITTHIIPRDEAIEIIRKHGYKVITILRDPRDHLISSLYFITSGKDVLSPILPFSYEEFSLLSKEEQIDELMLGHRFHAPAYEYCYAPRIPWSQLDPSVVYTTRFEKLVGPKGGGSSDEQIQEVQNIAEHIGIPLTYKKARKIARKLFGDTWSFRKGQIGAWKEEFTEKQKEIYMLKYRNEIESLGYEVH